MGEILSGGFPAPEVDRGGFSLRKRNYLILI